MSAHVVVIDSTFRRVKVAVTPAKYMTDILEEACAKFHFTASKYGLKNNNKPVDISRTFRQTGLSSGAKLELVPVSKSPSVVSVALQILDPSDAGPGRRLMDKFPSDTTLWLILRKFESNEASNLNFTARGTTEIQNGASGAGRIFYEMPNLNIMGRELSTFGDLQKTLAQLGLNSGSVLIKLAFKKTEQPLEDAMVEIGRYFREEAAAESSSASTVTPVPEIEGVTEAIARMSSAEPSGGEDSEMNDPTPKSEVLPEVDAPLPVTPSKRPAPVEESVLGPNQRPIAVYSAPSSNTPKAALVPHNENDYEPTIAHAKLHQARLLNKSQNQRLLSDAEVEQLEREKAAKLSTVKIVKIKFRFPDETTLVTDFDADETGAHLYDYVSDVMAAGHQPFKLVWNLGGSQTVPQDEKKRLVKNLKMESRVLVNVLWEDGASDEARNNPVLKPQYVQSAKEVTVPDIADVETEEESPSDKADGKKPSGGDGKGKGKGVPSWMPKNLRNLVKK